MTKGFFQGWMFLLFFSLGIIITVNKPYYLAFGNTLPYSNCHFIFFSRFFASQAPQLTTEKGV
jgi:hypothetical protein